MKNGVIGLNARVVHDYVKDFRYGNFLFDKNGRLLGIQLCKQKDTDTYAIKLGPRGNLRAQQVGIQ